MPPRTSNRRWLQFRLRTLLATIAVVAIICWLAFNVLPWWKWRQRELNWEHFCKQFHAGYQPTGLLRMRPDHAIIYQNAGAGGDEKGEYFWWAYLWKDSIHLLIFKVDHATKEEPKIPPDWRKCQSFRVYRLRMVRAGYLPRTNRGREAETKWFRECIYSKEQLAYLGDYVEVLLTGSGNEDAAEYQCEVVYEDET